MRQVSQGARNLEGDGVYNNYALLFGDCQKGPNSQQHPEEILVGQRRLV